MTKYTGTGVLLRKVDMHAQDGSQMMPQYLLRITRRPVCIPGKVGEFDEDWRVATLSYNIEPMA